jgi:hypothetical protein
VRTAIEHAQADCHWSTFLSAVGGCGPHDEQIPVGSTITDAGLERIKGLRLRCLELAHTADTQALQKILSETRFRRLRLPDSGSAPACAEAGAEVEGQERFAQAGIAVQHGQLAQGQPARPEPGHRTRGQLAK